jgi:hypothetical protein
MTRELDREVAERVMGMNLGSTPSQRDESMEFVPDYSTSVDRAFLVVEKMRERGFKAFKLYQHPEPLPHTDWLAAFDMGGGPYIGADTAPEAICRAALAALKEPRP